MRMAVLAARLLQHNPRAATEAASMRLRGEVVQGGRGRGVLPPRENPKFAA